MGHRPEARAAVEDIPPLCAVFARNLKTARKRASLKLYAAADQLGVSKSTWSQWEPERGLGVTQLNLFTKREHRMLVGKPTMRYVISMKKSPLFHSVAVAAMLSWCGCQSTSFRFQGDVPQRSPDAVAVANKYRVDRILYSSGGDFFHLGQMSDWKGPDECGSILSVARILNEAVAISDVMRRMPEIFTKSDEGIPLEVKILTRSESVVRHTFLCLMTVGILPGGIEGTSQCEVTVAVLGKEGARESCDVHFQMQRKLSCFLPSALFAYDGVPGVVSCRTGNVVDTVEDWQAVFTETLEVAIKECIRKLEQRTQDVP